MVAARPLPAGRAGAGPVCRAAFRPVGAVAGGVASRAPGSLGAGGGTFRSVPACRRTKGPAAGFDRMSFHRSAPFPLSRGPRLCDYSFTFFAEASPVNWRAVDKVFTGALQGAVLAVGATFTKMFTVSPLQRHKRH